MIFCAAIASGAPTPVATPARSEGASLAVSPAKSPSPKPALSPAASTPGRTSRTSVLSYLGQVIAWYRILAVEEQITRDPADIVFIADDRQMAGDVLHLAFDYARAQATLVKAMAGENAQPTEANVPASTDLIARRDSAQAEVAGLTAKIADLNLRLRRASRRARDPLNRELVVAQGQLDLAQSHVDSLNALIEFETGSIAGDTTRNSLSAQIDELEASLPNGDQGKTAAQAQSGAAPSESVQPSEGFVARGEYLIKLQRKRQTLDDAIRMTTELTAAAATQRDQLIQSLREIDDQSVREAHQASSSDIATVRQTKAAFQQLASRRKLVGEALQPLARQIVTLNLYSANLKRWRHAISQRFNAEIRSLALRIIGLAVLFGLVFLGSAAWRKLTFRYVPDIQRRHQLMRVRRFAVGVVIALLLIFGLGGDLRVLATVMGFAAAGIALALQNVILSFAGYFYISGRFGIRVGDRVQLSGITGDVLEIGLFKLALMELTNDASGRQPTGRIVVFPNSIVFQPNGNFFNQLPGANYLWNEMRLTLAPDCDYRLAEKRVLEVVGAVFARYRESVQRDYHNVESGLNIMFEVPRPQSRLQLSDAGIEVVVRYPVPLQATALAADEISRRLIDAINREPGLRFVPQSNPSLQRAADLSSNDSESAAQVVAAAGPNHPAEPPAPASDSNAGITPAAAAVAGAVGAAAASAVVSASSPPAPPPSEPPKT